MIIIARYFPEFNQKNSEFHALLTDGKHMFLFAWLVSFSFAFGHHRSKWQMVLGLLHDLNLR